MENGEHDTRWKRWVSRMLKEPEKWSWGPHIPVLPNGGGGGGGGGWGRTHLPQSNFFGKISHSLEMQIKKKNQNCLISFVQNHFKQKSIGVQPWSNSKWVLFINYMVLPYAGLYAVCNGCISGCCQIELGSPVGLFRSSYLLCTQLWWCPPPPENTPCRISWKT